MLCITEESGSHERASIDRTQRTRRRSDHCGCDHLDRRRHLPHHGGFRRHRDQRVLRGRPEMDLPVRRDTWGWIHVVMGALAVIAGIGWPPQVWRYRPRTPARGWWGSVWAARSAPGRGGLVVRSVAIPPGFMSHPDLSGIVTTPATRPV